MYNVLSYNILHDYRYMYNTTRYPMHFCGIRKYIHPKASVSLEAKQSGIQLPEGGYISVFCKKP